MSPGWKNATSEVTLGILYISEIRGVHKNLIFRNCTTTKA